MLTIVGTGYAVAGQVTAEALACIQKAEKLFYLVVDGITAIWLETQNPTAESLHGCYKVGRCRSDSYEEMVECILKPVRAGSNVCAAFYGHPGVLCDPGHETVRRAREEGFSATMLPGISAMDCLLADLRLEPSSGMQAYEASDFLKNRRKHDPRCMLLLWQAGAIGVRTFKRQDLWSRAGVQRLVARLTPYYSPNHEVVIYEATHSPISGPKVKRVLLRRLARQEVTIASTLYVPPK
jgi:siroheme synthase